MQQTDAWEEAPASATTIQGLKLLCEQLIDARTTKEDVAEELKKANEAVSDLERKILAIMKENAMPNFKGEFGSISIKTNKSISQPESMEEKLQLFDYLKSEGIFEEMVNVNSRTLSSWASKEIEAREQSGVFGWVPPGLKPASEYQSLSVRKK